MNYLVEEDAGFRAYEFYEDAPGDRDPGVIAWGADLRVINKDTKEIVRLELQKLILPNSLLKFIVNSPIFDKMRTVNNGR